MPIIRFRVRSAWRQFRTTSRSTRDGVLTAEMVGTDSNVEGRLKKLVAKARDAQKQRLEAASVAGGRSGR